MSTEKIEHLKQLVDKLTPEQLESIGGGLACSPSEITTLVQDLQQNYDTLVDFTSHVIERVLSQ